MAAFQKFFLDAVLKNAFMVKLAKGGCVALLNAEMCESSETHAVKERKMVSLRKSLKKNFLVHMPDLP